MFKCTSAQVLMQRQSKRDSLAKEQCGLVSNPTTSAGNLHAKNLKNTPRGGEKSKLGIQFLCLCRPNNHVNAPLQKRRALCYLRKPICQNDIKKNTPRGGKKQNCECVCTTICCTVKTPLAQLYQMRPNGQFYKNGKGLLTSGQINGTIVISMR